jgi:hypothetical protein
MNKIKYFQFKSSDILCLSAHKEWNHTDFLHLNTKTTVYYGDNVYKSSVPNTMIFYVENEEDEKNGIYYEILTGLPITIKEQTSNGEKVFYLNYKSERIKQISHEEVIKYFSKMSKISRWILAAKYKKFYVMAPNSIKDIEAYRQREKEIKEAIAYSYVKKNNKKTSD